MFQQDLRRRFSVATIFANASAIYEAIEIAENRAARLHDGRQAGQVPGIHDCPRQWVPSGTLAAVYLIYVILYGIR